MTIYNGHKLRSDFTYRTFEEAECLVQAISLTRDELEEEVKAKVFSVSQAEELLAQFISTA